MWGCSVYVGGGVGVGGLVGGCVADMCVVEWVCGVECGCCVM